VEQNAKRESEKQKELKAEAFLKVISDKTCQTVTREDILLRVLRR